MTYSTILWDHDGVLVDTERWYFEATRRTLAGLGFELSRETYMAHLTGGGSSWAMARETGMSEEELRGHKQRRNELYQEFIRTEAIEIDGAREVVEELDGTHRMAIVTTARREDFDLIHAERDLLPFFDFVLALGDYPRTKPHPDPYLAALERFGVSKDEAVVVEDSTRGLESARRAGIDCIVIRSPFMKDQDFSDALHVVESIREVPPLVGGGS